MNWTRLSAKYGFAIAFREWQRCQHFSPQVRVGVAAFLGAVLAPFVVFVNPLVRLYWLITGRRPPRRLSWLAPPSYAVVNPFPAQQRPREIRELLERPEYNWDPDPEDFSRWFRAWGLIAQVLRWEVPPRDVAKSLSD